MRILRWTMSPWVEYDSRADALTITFSEEPVAHTADAGHGRLVDLDASDNVVAIEVLGVSAGFAVNDVIAEYHLEERFREVEGALPSQSYRHYA